MTTTTTEGCGVCGDGLRVAEGYVCINCITDEAKRICRTCKSGMEKTGRTLNCPFCRGDWKGIIELGKEAKYKEDAIATLYAKIDVYNGLLKDAYKLVAEDLAILLPLLPPDKKLEYIITKGDTDGFLLNKVAIKDKDPPPPTTTTIPVNTGSFTRVLENIGTCQVKKPRGNQPCKYQAHHINNHNNKKVCNRHRDLIMQGRNVAYI